MAARHFSQAVGESWEDEGSAPDLFATAFGGKHFKEGAHKELPPLFVPTVPESFMKPVREDAKADAVARSRIDEITAELEDELRAEEEAKRQAEVAEREARQQAERAEEARRLAERAEAEARRQAEEEARRLAEEEARRQAEEAVELEPSLESETKPVPEPEPSLEPEPDPVSEQQSVPEPESMPKPESKPELEAVHQPEQATPNFWSDGLDYDLDEPLAEPVFDPEEFEDAPRADEALDKTLELDEPRTREDGLDATLVLDRVAERLASTVPEIHELPKERIEVSTDPVQQAPVVGPEPSVALARRDEPRPLGFFASIGEFFARLFRLDS